MQHIIKKFPSNPIGPNTRMAMCPTCKDPGYTLRLEEGDGVVFIRCRNACNVVAILYAVGLGISHLFSRWSYWRCEMFLGIVTLGRQAGIKISAADKEQERQVFVRSKAFYKAGIEAHKREKEREAREMVVAQTEVEQGETVHGED